MKVFIACSGADSVDLSYKNLASDICTMLVRSNHKLVFGGLDTGMMGKCYMTYKYEGGKIKAVVEVHEADSLDMLEVDSYEVTPTTFERTKGLYSSADLILVLPGGLATYGEFFSMIDEKRQKQDNKKIILFNYNHFYDPMLKMIEESYKLGFVNKSDLKIFDIVSDIKSLELYLKKIEGDR